MRAWSALLALTLVLAACGRGPVDPTPPFALDLAGSVEVVPGGAPATVAVEVSRDEGFDGAVTIDVEGLPSGVEAQPLEIAASETSGSLLLTADADAELGPIDATVVALAGGHRVERALRVDVVAVAQPVGLSVNVLSDAVVEPGGAPGTVTVEVAHSDASDEDVVVNVEGLPEGVTAPALVIPASEPSGVLQLTAAPDAVPGTYTVTAVGTSGGDTASDSFQLVVEAPAAGSLDTTYGHGDGTLTEDLGVDSSSIRDIEDLGDGIFLFTGELVDGAAHRVFLGISDERGEFVDTHVTVDVNAPVRELDTRFVDGRYVTAIVTGDASTGFHLFVLAHTATDGALSRDLSYGTDGAVFGDVPDLVVTDVEVQADETILVVGYAPDPGGLPGNDTDLVIARFVDASAGDIALDTTFSGDGYVFLDGSGDDRAHAVLGTEAGTIWIVGAANVDVTGGEITGGDFLVAQLSNGGGVVTGFPFVHSVSSDADVAYAVAPHGPGVVVGGEAGNGAGGSDAVLIRVGSGGALDTSFGDGGVARTPLREFHRVTQLAVQSDDRIVAAGVTERDADIDIVVARFTASGVRDTDFAGDGLTVVQLHTSIVYDLELTDRRIVVAGEAGMDPNFLDPADPAGEAAFAVYWQ